MSKEPQLLIGYSSTHLVEVSFTRPQKHWIPKVKYLGKIIRLIRDMQIKLYGPFGAEWLRRYFFEILTTDRPLKDLEQYIKE